MSLKYFFFPLFLIALGGFIWGYVRPEVTLYRSVNEKYKANQQSLQVVLKNKDAFNMLSLKLKEDQKSRGLILNYIPFDRVEEQIIGEISYLATNSGVFLDNVKITDQISTGSFGGSTQTNSLAQKGPDNKSVVDVVQSTQAKIIVNGDYEKLKIFFKGVQHLPLLNSVKSLNITLNSNKPAVDGTTGVARANQATTPITAEMVVDFGYLKQVKADKKELADFNPEIDSKTVQALQEYISADIPPVVSTTGVLMGSNNPFLP